MAPGRKTTNGITKKGKGLAMSANMAKLEELPTEVVESMAAQMDLDTICSFRSTSKYAAQCADFHFKRNYNHTIYTDLSREDFERLERRLVEDPKCVLYIDTLSVNPKALRADGIKPAMGTGFTWNRLGGGTLDMEQPLVTQWHGLLRRFINLAHFEINSDLCLGGISPSGLPCSWELSPHDVFVVAMPFIRNSNLPATSLDVYGPNLDTGCAYEDMEPARMNEKAVLQALFPPCGLGPGWPHLTSLTIRRGGFPPSGRFANIIASAPNLKRLTLLGDMVHVYMEDVVANAHRFQLEEIDYGDLNYSLSDPTTTFCPLLQSQRTTLKKLTLAHMTAGPCAVVMRFLIDGGFSALEEITIDNACQVGGGAGVRFVHTPGVQNATIRSRTPGQDFRMSWSSFSAQYVSFNPSLDEQCDEGVYYV
ncbi:hypothetical protein BJY00DRAFT_310363 [Aspergillus carlsbadensis]|nr:hypothetical protein BJY00DRAFT_310363 [Aspergillus carlsbadensis]